jgi:hypothetical protein
MSNSSPKPLLAHWRLAGLLLALLGLTGCPTPPPPPLPTPPPPLGAGMPWASAPIQGTLLFVAVPRLNLRACPANNCQILKTLPRGTELASLGGQGVWVQVQVQATGMQGWVNGKYLSTQPQARRTRTQTSAPVAGQPAPPAQPEPPMGGEPPTGAESPTGAVPPGEEWADAPGGVPADTSPGNPAPAAPAGEEFAPVAPR